jgi:hypothetical protein
MDISKGNEMSERIKLEMNTLDILYALSEGNPGGLSVMIELMEAAPKIDPQAAFKGLQPLLSLDNLQIYGSDIWILYKDLCGQDVLKVLTIFRCIQMGILSEHTLKTTMRNPFGVTFPHTELLEKLKEKLPSFNPIEETV